MDRGLGTNALARAGLYRNQFVAHAADFADDIGQEQLTLASVAKYLGVHLPSPYNHFEGLEGLRREIVTTRVARTGGVPQRRHHRRSRQDAVCATADAYRVYAMRFPGRYTATVAAPSPTDTGHNYAAAAVLHVVVSVLHGYELDGDPAIHAVRELRASLQGWADLEKSGTPHRYSAP